MSKEKMCYFNHIWLSEKLEELDIKPAVFARHCKISTSSMSVIMRGEKKPTKRTERVVKGLISGLKKFGVDINPLYDRPGKSKQKTKSIEEENPIMTKEILDHFGLKKEPFKPGIAPPEHFFANNENQTLTKLIINGAVNSEFMLIIGEVGSGKSTLLHKVKTMLQNDKTVKIGSIPSILMKRADDRNILNAVLKQIGNFESIPQAYENREEEMINVLDQARENKIRPVFLMDEAHQLSETILKDLRLLHEEYGSISPLAIILFAQPVIKSTIYKTSMKEVRDRIQIKEINAFKGTDSITKDNIERYINKKLQIAGNGKAKIFTPDAITEIFQFARTPLDVNSICRKALYKAYNIGEKEITRDLIAEVVNRREIKR